MNVDANPVDEKTRTAALDSLKQIFGDRFTTAEAIRHQHGKDESYHTPMAPDAVVFAETEDEISQAVSVCNRLGFPVIPFGTGTSLEGHVAAMRGGVTIDTSLMDRIISVNAEDLDVVVQPGVTRKQLNEHLRDTGLFFPIDPGADASIGGMTATRASGTNAVRYGTMRENVISLRIVTPSGEVIRTSRRARKSSAGYDLTRLFVGSEGTLGVITEITLKVYGIPEAISSAVCQFDTMEGAVDSVITTIHAGVPVARMELLDEVQMGACIGYSKLEGYQPKPTIFFEFHGSEAGVKEQAETVEGITSEFGGSSFQWATRTEDRNVLWQARHDAYYAALAQRPGAQGWPTDVCVPVSRLAECIRETKADLEETGLYAPLVGHVGDGNFHLVYIIDPENSDEMGRAKAHSERMVRRALAMDGTCTGEHGVGYGKMPYLEEEHGAALNLMRSLKQAVDPNNIMNPGKIVRI